MQHAAGVHGYAQKVAVSTMGEWGRAGGGGAWVGKGGWVGGGEGTAYLLNSLIFPHSLMFPHLLIFLFAHSCGLSTVYVYARDAITILYCDIVIIIRI